MQLIPLLDRSGHVRAWADRKTGWIGDPNGNVIALIEFCGVFKAQAHAQQIGWYECDGVIRNRRGQVVLIQPNAKVDGVVMPRSQRIPAAPKLRLPIGRPVLNWHLTSPMRQHAWADFESLFDELAQLRAFAKQLRSLANRPHRVNQKASHKRMRLNEIL
jgi:hypothetical protein